MTFTDQSRFDIRVEWGAAGIEALAGCRTFVIVDVLSFSTCVSVAAAREVMILPFRTNDHGAVEFAARHGALLAGRRGDGYSLSPGSLLDAPSGLRLALPSPNGGTLSLDAANRGVVIAGCLRNRAAVCRRAASLGGPIAVIPAGERWPDGTIRFALEDLIGAGAIAAMLPGTRSPEAEAAIALFESVADRLLETLSACCSGRELWDRGFAGDVALASELDADTHAPQLRDGAFSAQPTSGEAT